MKSLISAIVEMEKKLRWCRAGYLFGSQIPVTTGEFELRISCIQCRYLTHYGLIA